ncbi:unnamed protein product [Polarella glacialis]|uniref:Uncharacterized protein n=1 Tax=Polarella glacialis TaxID=89957 RepID=A0A813EEU7_POLGL|nr:unnamed protein product [Polarella glacialis]
MGILGWASWDRQVMFALCYSKLFEGSNAVGRIEGFGIKPSNDSHAEITALRKVAVCPDTCLIPLIDSARAERRAHMTSVTKHVHPPLAMHQQ